MESFTNYLLISQKTTKSTSEIYQKLINVFEIWLVKKGLEANQMGRNEVLEYLKYLQQINTSDNGQQRQLTVLRHYFNYLQDAGQINSNPASKLYLKSSIRTVVPIPLSAKQLTNLYQSFEIKQVYDLEKKVIIGLLVYQALPTSEIVQLKTSDIHLNEGIIQIAQQSRANGRSLKLEGNQIAYLQAFINKEKTGEYLFSEIGKHKNYFYYLLKKLRKLEPNLINAQHIRQSIIANWTKLYDMRIVQYMTGHKWISSVQRYDKGSLETLQAEIDQLHPLNNF
jgi:site-specific recombinase XerD